MSTEPASMSLSAVARAIADKRLSSREVTQSCLERIAQWQPHLNAFMAIEADEAERRYNATTRYRVTVSMEGGGTRTVEVPDLAGIGVGTHVKVSGGDLQVI